MSEFFFINYYFNGPLGSVFTCICQQHVRRINMTTGLVQESKHHLVTIKKRERWFYTLYTQYMPSGILFIKFYLYVQKVINMIYYEQHHHTDTHRLKNFITPPRLHIQTCTSVSGTSIISKLLCTLLPLWGRSIVSLVPDSRGQTDVQFCLAQTPTGLSRMLWRSLDTPIINTVEY